MTYGIYVTVLIVPLWNWNLDSTVKASAKVGSNRTFMELKSHLRASELVAPVCSNRTFMELKFKIGLNLLL